MKTLLFILLVISSFNALACTKLKRDVLFKVTVSEFPKYLVISEKLQNQSLDEVKSYVELKKLLNSVNALSLFVKRFGPNSRIWNENYGKYKQSCSIENLKEDIIKEFSRLEYNYLSYRHSAWLERKEPFHEFLAKVELGVVNKSYYFGLTSYDELFLRIEKSIAKIESNKEKISTYIEANKEKKNSELAKKENELEQLERLIEQERAELEKEKKVSKAIAQKQADLEELRKKSIEKQERKISPMQLNSSVNKAVTQEEVAQALVIASGYTCDTVDKLLSVSWSGDFTLACNGYQYSYSIEDIGGNWTVKVK